MPKLFFAGDIGDIPHMKARYASEGRVLNERAKGKVWRRVCKQLLESKAKLAPPKESVKLKCQLWPEITKNFAKKCLDASSLSLSKKISA